MNKLLGIAALAGVLLVATPQTAAACAKPRFAVRTPRFQVGQAPTWSPDGRRWVYKKQGPLAGVQVYTANTNGSHERCLTCGRPGPNQVAHFRRQGDKILFHSWGKHTFQFGSPGFAGVGSDFFVMNPDGSHVVNLSKGDEGEDNFHAYFSPDGKRIAWTHIDWALNKGGHGLWDVRVADYVNDRKGPRLTHTRVVRPANGHFYETQWWSPDGRGFLFTESVDNALNLELFIYDLRTGRSTRLTDNPAWDEQAIFTKDGKKVIFMSTRGRPSNWQTWAQVSDAALPTADADFLLITPLFFGLFFSPVYPPSTDLYELDLTTRKVRRLTFDGNDGWIIPEFAWDPTGTKLLWTELKTKDELRISDFNHLDKEVEEATHLLDNPQPPSSVGFDANMVARTRLASYVC